MSHAAAIEDLSTEASGVTDRRRQLTAGDPTHRSLDDWMLDRQGLGDPRRNGERQATEAIRSMFTGISVISVPVETSASGEPGWRVLFGYRFLRLRAPVARRLAQLTPGLGLFGVAIALTIAADLGTNPWTVFAQGVAERTGASVGTIVALTGLTLLIAFGPLGEPLGVGTLLNVAIIGPIIDLVLALLGDGHSIWTRIVFLGLAPPVLGLASGRYLGAGLGPGPRDGLMTAWARRGVPIARARTMIEVAVLVVGWLLGGVVGIGTIYFGLTVGFWVRTFLLRLQIDRPAR